MLLCLLSEKTFINDAMKPAKMKDHLEMSHSDKKKKNLDFFKKPKKNFLQIRHLVFLKSIL